MGNGGGACRPSVCSGLLEEDYLPGRLAIEIGGDLIRDPRSGSPPWVVVEVGVARCGRRVAVAEDRAEYRQPEIGRHAHAGEAVSLIPRAG